ncbi:unnamed protein product, partial [Eruca vesicaria subsp. sativa]|nr:unnamed protein product [Eruca vesicaria subsp. sativa]
ARSQMKVQGIEDTSVLILVCRLYTIELELEVAHLQTENARHKRQQEQLRMAAANQQPKKNTLQRSSTAPF